VAIVSVFVFVLLSAEVKAQQQPYFVDGYHGGVYGHYPLEWKTRFIVDQMEQHPEWRISLEIEPETWDSVAVHTPVDYRRMQELIKSPRVEFTNPTYAQPYAYNISGESIIRQFQYGIRKINEHFPNVEHLTYAVEEPCFTSALPQILSQLGYKYASLKCPNTCWGGYAAPFGGETVNWIGPDGSSILTSPRHEVEELQKGSVWQTTAWGNQPDYLKACREAGIEHVVGMCFQDAGWKNGPWIGYGDKTRGGSKYVTWREYFEMLGIERGEQDYHFTQEDVRPALMWGSQVMQRIGRQVRRSENIIPQAEKMATMATLLSPSYTTPQEKIDEAWRTLMLAQHHDSWIVPYNGLHRRGTWADWIREWTRSADRNALEVIQSAQNEIAGTTAQTNNTAVLRVWNTQPYARHEAVRVALPKEWRGYEVEVQDSEGNRFGAFLGRGNLVFDAQVPAFGYATYRLIRTDRRVERRRGNMEQATTIENDLYRIVVDAEKGGVIRELICKQTGENWVDSESAGWGELKGYFLTQKKFRSSTETPAKVTTGRWGNVGEWMMIEGEISSHPFTQFIVLYKNSPVIDVELRIDWQEDEAIGEFRQRNAWSTNRRACYDDRYKLTLLFPMPFEKATLDKNAPFDVCRSQLENTHFGKWDEIKHNVILHWVDVAERGENNRSLALMTDHTTSYSFGKGEALGLTVQYSGAGLWGRKYTITEATSINYALVPHRGDWDEAGIEQIRAMRAEPLLSSLHEEAEMTSASLMELSGKGYELVAAYPSEEGIVVRLYNAAADEKPQRLMLGFEAEKVEQVDLNGKTTDQMEVKTRKGKSSFEVQMPRFGFRTYIIYKK
jgi:alpha-mannosidase